MKPFRCLAALSPTLGAAATVAAATSLACTSEDFAAGWVRLSPERATAAQHAGLHAKRWPREQAIACGLPAQGLSDVGRRWADGVRR